MPIVRTTTSKRIRNATSLNPFVWQQVQEALIFERLLPFGWDSISRAPERSTVTRQPGGTTVVAVYSVTINGPGEEKPDGRVSRSSTRVGTFLPAKETAVEEVEGEWGLPPRSG